MKKRIYLKSVLCVSAVLFFAGSSLRAEPLSIDGFLNEVQKQHQGYEASQKGVEAGESKSREGELALSYSLFSTLQYSNDKRPSNFAFVVGDRAAVSTYSLGVSKLTTFGLNASLSYNVNYFYFHGANSAFLTNNQYYQMNPQLDLTLSLWRNSFGRQTRAIVEATNAKNLSTSYTESYRSKLILSDAEALYWRASLVKELVKVEKINLDRAREIRDWNKRRVSLNLTDKVDLLQADANLKIREMSYETAIDEERTALRDFNTMRGVAADEINEELQNITVEQILALPLPERKGTRDDVMALKEAARAAAANANLSKDKNAPSLDLFSTLTVNGRDPAFDTSFKQSWGGLYPYTVVGIKFVAPLDLGNIKRVNSGYEAEKISAEYTYERKRFEADRDWNDLTKSVDDTKKRLQIANEIEDLQFKKFTYEQNRQHRGQTTTYQVLTFEQDYATAQYNRIKLQDDVLRLIAQMKTFIGKEEL